MEDNPLYCVLIPYKDGADKLITCLDALVEHLPPRTIVLLVDDGSTPTQPELDLYASGSRIHLLRHEMPQGPAAARNTGIEWCRTKNIDIVILLDSDCIPGPDFVKSHVRLHKEHEDVVCIGGAIQGVGRGIWARLDGIDNAALQRHSPAEMLPLGKGDAVRKGFDAASGDVLMILDADLTVPPEDLPKFYLPLAQGKAEFINGSRLVYSLEGEAMRSANLFGNKVFSLIFTWLLGQRIKDTLCGTKVLLKKDYEKINRDRSYFGDFDPFGDFDLLFGAARLGLKMVEVPVRYRRRTAGESKVRVIKHGWLLARMSLIGFHKFKLMGWMRKFKGLLGNQP